MDGVPDLHDSARSPQAALAPEPQLLGPQQLGGATFWVSSGLLLALAAIAAAYAVQHGVFVGPKPMVTSPAPARESTIVLSSADFAGSIVPVPGASTGAAPFALASLLLPAEQKKQIEDHLAKDTIRLGAMTLWDNVAEDGDAVEVSGAGFTQRLTILHEPKVFFVPYMPGGSIHISGVADGGGGITIAIKTALGDQFLPPLSPGQAVEIQIP
jgi:hypothetical protein